VIAAECEWTKTLDLIGGLYPDWKLTSEQLEEWRAAFVRRNPDWLRTAIRRHYTASRFKPHISDIRKQFDAVAAEQGQTRTLADEQTARIRAVDAEEQKYRDSMAHTADVLARIDRTRLLELRDQCVEQWTWAGDHAEHDDPHEWGDFFRGLVYAHIEEHAPDLVPGGHAANARIEELRS
jgi:disulfide oxidoreductase YuzD